MNFTAIAPRRTQTFNRFSSNLCMLSQKLSLVIFVALLGACDTTKKTLNLPTRASIEFNIAKDVNPDADDRASPIKITVFALSEDSTFLAADFIKLYQSAEEQLGPHLLKTIPLQSFVPGTQRFTPIEVAPNTTHIGLLAEYNRFDQSINRIVIPIKAHSNNKIPISVTRLGLTRSP